VSETKFKEPNADGSIVVQLAGEIKLKNEVYSRVTIPALRGKHLARLTFGLGSTPSNAQIIEWADYVVEPLGSVGEMSPRDALAVSAEVYSLLGKSLRTGEPASE
jgi:hypothetical protein